MRKLIAALCVLMSMGLASGAVAQQWTEFSPGDARFRVEMPGTPDVHSNTIPELGSLKLTIEKMAGKATLQITAGETGFQPGM